MYRWLQLDEINPNESQLFIKNKYFHNPSHLISAWKNMAEKRLKIKCDWHGTSCSFDFTEANLIKLHILNNWTII